MQKINNANTYLFDLDDTLYCPKLGILKQVESRMHKFISDALSLPLPAATVLSNHYYKQYGGTVKGLVKHHRINRDDFIHYCHDINMDSLKTQPNLGHRIDQLSGRKIIYTNSPKHYATKILTELALIDSFDDIFSLEDANYELKPHNSSYEQLCKTHAINSHETVFFDDQLRNLKPAKALGMTTVWLSGSEQVVTNIDYKPDYEANNLTQFFNLLQAS
ncbi:pyrimidine 5'-nucleotidase [Moritella sp. 24]|uniref:pyrimidine 5'-nucleotidase n=1 Tax=Moritella sp. 24 TaxID=2746230 RepID=UPI001BAAE326|nr:pyrimidine 5'-nucleotidase [Moritella sp. 24]QUM76641.1 pyrimidine 5'-nucleotidase [Moritella sp. 24]